MRFEVPQFIEVEDKIVGPFAWKQFIYLAGGGGTAVILFFMLPFFLFVIIAAPIVGLAGFLAFHRINNRPFSDFLESSVGYFSHNKLYLWRKKNEQIISAQSAPIVETAPAPDVLPSPTASNISSLSRKLELEALEGNSK